MGRCICNASWDPFVTPCTAKLFNKMVYIDRWDDPCVVPVFSMALVAAKARQTVTEATAGRTVASRWRTGATHAAVRCGQRCPGPEKNLLKPAALRVLERYWALNSPRRQFMTQTNLAIPQLPANPSSPQPADDTRERLAALWALRMVLITPAGQKQLASHNQADDLAVGERCV